MSDLEIGQRVDPAPVCATPRVSTTDPLQASQERAARLDAAERLLDKADRQVIEARRAIGVIRNGRGGLIYPRTRINEAIGLLHDTEQKLTEAMGVQAGAEG